MRKIVLFIFNFLLSITFLGFGGSYFGSIKDKVLNELPRPTIISTNYVSQNQDELNGIEFEFINKDKGHNYIVSYGGKVFEYDATSAIKYMLTHKKEEMCKFPLNPIEAVGSIGLIARIEYGVETDFLIKKYSYSKYLKQPESKDLIGFLNYGFINLNFKTSNIPVKKTIKVGDKWQEFTSVITENKGVMIGQEGSGNGYYLGNLDEYEFKGITENNGVRYAIIEINKNILLPNFYYNKNQGIGSEIYLNVSKLIIAYDYKNKIVKEVSCKGQYNELIDGAIDNPIKILKSDLLSDDFRKSLDLLKAGNFLSSGGFIGGGFFQMAGMVKAKKITNTEILPFFQSFTPEIIKTITSSIINGSKIYPKEFTQARNYEILYFYDESNIKK